MSLLKGKLNSYGATLAIEELVEPRNDPMKKYGQKEDITILARWLKRDHDTLQIFRSLEILKDITRKPAYAAVAIEEGVLPTVIRILLYRRARFTENVLDILENVARVKTLRRVLYEIGILVRLEELLETKTSKRALASTAYIYTYFCNVEYREDHEKCLSAFARLLKEENEKIMRICCSGIRMVLETNLSKIGKVINLGIVPQFVKMLDMQCEDIVVNSLVCLAKVSTGNSHETQAVIDSYVLKKLGSLLKRDSKISTKAMWLIRNVTAGTALQIQMVVDANLFRPIVESLTDSPKLRENAVCAIANIILCGNFVLIQESKNELLRILHAIKNMEMARMLSNEIINL